MRKLALTAIFVGATALAACGGGGDDDVSVGADANADQADAGGACNPVTQSGCDAGQKCTWVTVSEEPALGKTECVADGTVELGGTCVAGEPGAATGFDDCLKGGLCSDGLCTQICTATPDSCGDGNICTRYADTFDDLGEDSTVGLCNPTCNPVGQDIAGWVDCPEGEACYLQAGVGKASCAGVPPGAVGLQQGDICYGPEPQAGSCYLNGCDKGYQDILFQMPGGPISICAAFCSPVDTYLANAADPQGADPANCTAARVDLPNQECRFIQSIYNSSMFDGTIIPVEYGTCAPSATWGSCEDYNPVLMASTFNDEYAATVGDDAAKAAAANAALCEVCGLTDACDQELDLDPQCENVGCTSIATDEALFAMPAARLALKKIRELARKQNVGSMLLPNGTILPGIE